MILIIEISLIVIFFLILLYIIYVESNVNSGYNGKNQKIRCNCGANCRCNCLSCGCNSGRQKSSMLVNYGYGSSGAGFEPYSNLPVSFWERNNILGRNNLNFLPFGQKSPEKLRSVYGLPPRDKKLLPSNIQKRRIEKRNKELY